MSALPPKADIRTWPVTFGGTAPATWRCSPQSAAPLIEWSQSRSSFFDYRYAAATPITAPFFFKSKAAGLMFVRHCWSEGFFLVFERVEIDGTCASACTMLLGIIPRDHICVTTRAKLIFTSKYPGGREGIGLRR